MEYFFSYASFLCYDFHVVRWGLVRDRTIRRKWLHVIINDDFLEEGECYDRALIPSIICLGRLRIASKYIFNLWQLRQGVDSLAQWLEYWIFNREDWVRFPGKTEYFFSYASFLCYGFHVVRRYTVKISPAPWRPCFLTNPNGLNNHGRGSPKEHFCKIIWKSVQWFRTRRFLKFSI